ncbi:MAG: recombinase family protein [Clostridiales bacterium]|nr:recombinase family protein [Clostridiales bacterium]
MTGLCLIIVLVYQLDRFARNRYDSANYKAKLKKNGVRVLSAKENITDDASGILVEGMLESMAEYYSAELSQKVRRGINESLLKGNFIGGYGLLGYDIIDKKWTVNEREAGLIRDIFTRYKNGEKAMDIINRLNNAGIKTKCGGQFDKNTVARIIRNEKYRGKVVSRGKVYAEVIPPIVDERLFEACNFIMDGHKHKQRVIVEEKPYILSGKLHCGYCNSLMTAEGGTSHTGREYHYYKCFKRKRFKHECFKKNVAQKVLEDIVFEKTVEFVLQPHIITLVAELVVKKFNGEIAKTDTMITLEKELKEKEKSISAILKAIEQGIVTRSTQSRLLTLEQEKDEIEDKLSIEKARRIKPLEVDEVKAFINYYARKQYKNDEEKNDFFSNFINRVILYDERVIILYNTSPDSQTEVKLNEKKGLISIEDVKDHKKGSSLDLGFKREALGGEAGI